MRAPPLRCTSKLAIARPRIWSPIPMMTCWQSAPEIPGRLPIATARPTDSAVDHATIDQGRLSGHVVRIRAGQIGNERCNVLRCLGSPEGDAFHILFICRTLLRTGEFR